MTWGLLLTTNMESIEIRPLTVSDMATVEKFLKEEYYTREPARAHLGVSPGCNWMREKPVIQVKKC